MATSTRRCADPTPAPMFQGYLPPALALLIFLVWGNLLPPLAALLLDDRLARPLDHGIVWRDGRPLLGPHKTIRGILASLLGCAAAAPLFGLGWRVAATAATLLLAGDLCSSFIKRRLGHRSGDAVLGLDQLLEGLLPALYLAPQLHVPIWQVALSLALFVPLAHGGACFWKSQLCAPPTTNYPRLLRSTVRLREWRSCHQPLARWHAWFNLSSILYNKMVVGLFFRLLGLYRQGVENALRVELRELDITCPSLPEPFDGFTLLLLTDLHLDGLPNLHKVILDRLGQRSFDLCCIGGDIRMETYGPIAPSLRELRRLLPKIRARHGIFGVLGNHDCIEMAPDLEETGMTMLINDCWRLDKEGAALWLVGVDDPHYYRTHDLDQAFNRVEPQGFSILLAHSPEAYREAADHGANLYLCGHTHGGQICLPDSTPIYTNSRAPRFTSRGPWRYRAMQGYTSRGVGVSGAPLRFNCPGEIAILTLRKSENPAQYG